jgi:hypothetical protein
MGALPVRGIVAAAACARDDVVADERVVEAWPFAADAAVCDGGDEGADSCLGCAGARPSWDGVLGAAGAVAWAAALDARLHQSARVMLKNRRRMPPGMSRPRGTRLASRTTRAGCIRGGVIRAVHARCLQSRALPSRLPGARADRPIIPIQFAIIPTSLASTTGNPTDLSRVVSPRRGLRASASRRPSRR